MPETHGQSICTMKQFTFEAKQKQFFIAMMVLGLLCLVWSWFSEPEQIAEAVAWLASSNCFMTGEIMQVSGGAQLGRLPRANDLSRK